MLHAASLSSHVSRQQECGRFQGDRRGRRASTLTRQLPNIAPGHVSQEASPFGPEWQRDPRPSAPHLALIESGSWPG